MYNHRLHAINILYGSRKEFNAIFARFLQTCAICRPIRNYERCPEKLSHCKIKLRIDRTYTGNSNYMRAGNISNKLIIGRDTITTDRLFLVPPIRVNGRSRLVIALNVVLKAIQCISNGIFILF